MVENEPNYCIFCDKVLHNPPACCTRAKEDYENYYLAELADEYGIYVDGCKKCGIAPPCYCDIGVVD